MNSYLSPQLPQTHAWTVFAWPTVMWQLPCHSRENLQHLGTYVTSLGSPLAPCSGQTVWGEPFADSAAGLAWDWVELAEGIVAMADPMGVTTNIKLIGSNGGVMTPVEAAPHLNKLVHTLAWQTEVQQAMHYEVQKTLAKLGARH